MPKPQVAEGDSQPLKGEISATEMAKRLAITPQALSAWTRRSGAPVRVTGRHVWCRDGAFQRWREEQMVAVAVREAQPTDLDAARARKANADAEISELALAKARAQMVTVEDFEEAIGRMLDLLVARLRVLPSLMSGHGVEVEQAVEKEVEDLINELHNFDEDILPVEDHGEEI